MKNFYEFCRILNENAPASYNFETDNLDELIAAIYRLPDTIEYISVTDRLCSFSPGAKYFAPEDRNTGYGHIKGDPNWRDRAAEVLKKLKEDTERKHREYPSDRNQMGRPMPWEEIDHMSLSGHKGGGPTDSFYTSFSCPSYRKFGDDMRAGRYGPLD